MNVPYSDRLLIDNVVRDPHTGKVIRVQKPVITAPTWPYYPERYDAVPA